MKIILIAEPRCGTTNLYNYVASITKNYICYNEPFKEERIIYNTYIEYNKIISHKNIFVKQLYSHKPKEFLDKSFEEIYDLVYKDFDIIVFLDRIDKHKQSESYVHAQCTNIWHTPYDFDIKNVESKTILINGVNEKNGKDSLILYENAFKNTSAQILKTANKLNKKIYYYEDIYFNKQKMIEFLNELNIEFDEKLYNQFLADTNKYRKNLKIKSII
jgi:hypothetical protein